MLPSCAEHQNESEVSGLFGPSAAKVVARLKVRHGAGGQPGSAPFWLGKDLYVFERDQISRVNIQNGSMQSFKLNQQLSLPESEPEISLLRIFKKRCEILSYAQSAGRCLAIS